MYGYIYLTKNLDNNKIYIGQHKSKVFNKGYLGSGVNIRKSVKKYGKERFSVELIEWCETQEDADSKEVYYIDLYNSTDPNIGYNITIGGQKRFFTGQSHTEEAKEKMSEAAKNRPHYPTTKGRSCYTNGVDNKVLKPEDFAYYESLGWVKGRTVVNKKSWNKGLTKETDERVKAYTEKRNKIFSEGGSIGCFGVKGNTNGFKKGNIPWNKGKFGYNNGHPNYYHGKKNKDK